MASKKKQSLTASEIAKQIKVKVDSILEYLSENLDLKEVDKDTLIEPSLVDKIKNNFKEKAKKIVKNKTKKSTEKKEEVKKEKVSKRETKKIPTSEKKKKIVKKVKEEEPEEETKDEIQTTLSQQKRRIRFSHYEDSVEEEKIEEIPLTEKNIVEEEKKEIPVEQKKTVEVGNKVNEEEKAKIEFPKEEEEKKKDSKIFDVKMMEEVKIEKKEEETNEIAKPSEKRLEHFEKRERKDFRYKNNGYFSKNRFEEVKPVLDKDKKFINSEEITKSKKGKKKKIIDEKIVEKSIQQTIKAIRAGELSHRKKYKEKPKDVTQKDETKKISISDFIVVSELAERINVDPVEMIEKGIELGLMVTINQRIDFETASILLMEFGYEVEKITPKIETKKEEKKEEDKTGYELHKRPPIITIMGHVDHGKTTLIDYLRNSRIVDSEHGKITQDLGAYTVQTKHGLITFLDTPGHEAFTAMRARGAQITDIALIVVSAIDGVQPQTVEAINHAKLANVPFIIVINKIDLPDADIGRVKRELLNINVVLEEFGGNVPSVAISAKTGKNINELLETIAFQAEILDLKAPFEGSVKGTVIEIKQAKGLGSIFNCIIQKGTLRKDDYFVVGKVFGKVRKILNEFKEEIQNATPGIPVMVVGANELPEVGDILITVENEKIAKEMARERYFAYKEQLLKKREITSLDGFEKQLEIMKKKELNIIIKGKAYGSIEALADSLQILSNEDAIVNVILKDVGIVTENDVNAAIASKGMIIAFDTSIDPNAKAKAKTEGIIIKQYNIIYDVIDDIKNAIKSFKEVTYENRIIGTAEVREIFKISKVGTIAGLYVLDGKILRNGSINVLRNGSDLGLYPIKSLKRFKDDVKEVESGYECAILLDGFDDLQKGDIFKCIVKVEKTD